MKLDRLRDFTTARVALGRTGDSLPTRELLDFQLAHARARDAVHATLDASALRLELHALGVDAAVVHSAARDRSTYLRRPDLGRILDDESRTLIAAQRAKHDAVFIAADGLSALAVERHAAPLLQLVLPRFAGPVILVEQGRVAIGDDIGETIGAGMAVLLIGERPGLSAPDSLGVYLTWRPRRGLTDADRNCISNIRADGLSYAAAAHKLLFLMNEARRRKLSGIALKEEAGRIE
jgi:ethanolamine ammonia-lyase small subunit